MHTQSTRLKSIFGQSGIIALVAIGLLAASDVNDDIKVNAAYQQYDSQTTGDSQKNMQTKAEFGATVSLLRGIKDLAENVFEIDVPKVANAIACAKANDLIDFGAIDTGFNPNFVKLLQRDGVQVEVATKPSEIEIDQKDMLQALRHVDTAYTAFELAGIPQDILDIAFEKVLLNQRLQTAMDIYGVWASKDSVEA